MRNKPRIKDGVVLYSSITQIFYKMKKGVLMKYPTYAGANRCWSYSLYSMDFKHMTAATKEQLKELA